MNCNPKKTQERVLGWNPPMFKWRRHWEVHQSLI